MMGLIVQQSVWLDCVLVCITGCSCMGFLTVQQSVRRYCV